MRSFQKKYRKARFGGNELHRERFDMDSNNNNNNAQDFGKFHTY